MPGWSSWKRMAVAAGGVAIIMAVYGVLLVPLIEGAPQERRDLASLTNPVADWTETTEVDFPGLFPPDAWELGQRKRLQVDQGTAYFQHYAPNEDGDLEVQPFTLVFAPARAIDDPRPPEPPLVLTAPGGALLKFDQPVKLGVPRAGRLQQAVLRGEVTIDRAAGVDSDALHLVAHNVQLQNDFVVTPHRVEFQLGGHRGAGENLVIQLLTDAAVSPDSPLPPIRGIRSLELIKLDYLILAAPPNAAPSPTLGTTEFEVRCKGAFKFDLAASEATLRDQVRINHWSQATRQLLESLAADRMTIRFERRSDATGRTGAYGQSLPTPTDLEIAEVLAVGAPAILDSPARRVRAEAALLGYSPTDRRINLQDKQRVLLIHEDMRFEAPNLEYYLTDDRAIGRAFSEGPGWVHRDATPRQAALHVQWNEAMQLRPHDGLDVLSLYGSPEMSLGADSQFTAKNLHIWLRGGDLGAGSEKPTRRVEPEKMLAEEECESNPLNSQATRNLEVFWEVGASQPTINDTGATTAIPAQPAGHSSGSSSPANSPFQLRADGTPGSNQQRMRVDGDLVRVHLKPAERSYEVQEITVKGSAQLREESAEPGVEPLAIAGSELRVESIGQGLFSAYVVSEQSMGKATLAARGLELFGAELQMDQRTHRTWMEGPGEARFMPTGESSPNSQLDGPATVTWQGGLEFDGQVVRVRGQVVIVFKTLGRDGSRSVVRIQGDSLDVTLNERVDFRTQVSPRSDKIEVERIEMPGAVVLDHWESSPQGEPISIDRFLVRDVALDYASGELSGLGPGWGQSIRAGQAAPLESQPATPDARERLTLVRVAFLDRMEGNVLRKSLAFVQQVEVLADTAEHWEDWKDRETMLSSPEVVTMRGERLETAWVQDEQTRQASWEMAMVGNASVQARSFDATAHRMVYVESKDLIILEGNQRDDAQLTWARRGAAGRDSARARKIMYWKTLGNVEVDGVSSFDATFSGRLDRGGRGTAPRQR
ncbi:MAG: hypothetical protein R3B96_00980 [Pirellulaceae bacterium]